MSPFLVRQGISLRGKGLQQENTFHINFAKFSTNSQVALVTGALYYLRNLKMCFTRSSIPDFF